MFKNTALVLVSAMALAASVAVADIPDPGQSHAETAAPGSVLYNRIDGLGYAFTAAHLGDGTVVDGTITLTVLNYLGQPLPNHAAEDFWLTTSGGSLAYPANGTIADAATDAAGQTIWQQPLMAGGCTVGETVVVLIEGNPLLQDGINMGFVSPDTNGDLAVNLADLSTFAAGYTVAYDVHADLFYDGVINLSDLALFAQGYGI